MKKPTLAQSTKYLAKHKGLFGFSDWSIKVLATEEDGENIAEAEYDHWGKELTIKLHKPYFEREDWQNTLIHEFVHARIGVANAKFLYAIGKTQYLFEEEAVNDIVSGIMELINE